MDNHPEKLNEGVVRQSGDVTPWNAGDAVAATVDVCRAMGIPLAPSVKARLGKGAKALIAADFDPTIVVAAMVTAVQTCMFGSTESIAQELVIANSGHKRSRGEYQRALAETAHLLTHRESRVWQIMREETARKEARKEIE